MSSIFLGKPQSVAGKSSISVHGLTASWGNYNQALRSANENLANPQKLLSALRFSGRMILASDIGALLLAFICGGLIAWMSNLYLLTGSFQPLASLATLKQFTIFIGMGTLALLWLDMRGHYRQRLPFWETTGHILSVALVGFLVCGFIQFVAQSTFSRLWLGMSWILFGALLFAGRSLTRNWLSARGQWQIPAIMIGNSTLAAAAQLALSREPGMGYEIKAQLPAESLGQLTKPHAWKQLLANHGACHILLAVEGSALEQQQAALKCLVRERMPFSIVPPWLGLPSTTLSPHHFMLHDVMIVHDTNRLHLPLPCFLKRGFDLLIAGTALLALSPLFLLIILAVRRDGGPAFFKQYRVGKNGRQFFCYKFRSMRIDAESFLGHYLAEHPDAQAEWKKYQKLKRDVRITPFGQILRRTSLDELPQLLNVIKGEMSLVGPRPIMPGQEHYYGDDFIYYESVLPGITGPWQVSGRNQLAFKERVMLESCYSRNWSLWMDIVILLKTFPTVLKKEQAF